VKTCQDCGCTISEHATHTGHEKWCEDCFDKGLCRDMDDHFKNTVKTEMADHELKKKRQVVEYCLERSQFMWAAYILGILLECDFRDSKQKASEWLKDKGAL